MIKFTRLAGALGADVHGIDLSQPLSKAEIAAITEARLEHLVLFFREQPLLTVAQHKALAANFGDLETTTYRRTDLDDKIQVVEGGTDVVGYHVPTSSPTYHCDSSYKEVPPLGAFLQARVMPERGGDTCFASTYAAYDSLSSKMQGFLDGLEAYHSVSYMHRVNIGRPGYNLRAEVADAEPVKKPVINIHPDTGRKFLNVNIIYTSHIADMREDESTLLLKFLYEHIRRPEFGVRMHWNVGDVTFWDNWSTQHYGVPDFTGHRLLHRVLVLRRQAAQAVAA